MSTDENIQISVDENRSTGYSAVLCFTLIFLLSQATGCGPSARQPASSGSSSAQKVGSSSESRKLPALDEYIPPIDEGRIEIAPPKGWYLPPRTAKVLFRTQRNPKQDVPVISLTAQDWPELATLDPKATEEFIKHLASERGRDPKTYRPVQLGNRTWVASRGRAREAGRVARVLDVLTLETVAAGRRYTLRLICDANELEQWEPYLQAVAQGIRFGSEAILAAETGASASPIADTSEGKEIAQAQSISEQMKGETQASGSEESQPVSPSKISSPTPASERIKAPTKAAKPASEEPVLDLESLEELLR